MEHHRLTKGAWPSVRPQTGFTRVFRRVGGEPGLILRGRRRSRMECGRAGRGERSRAGAIVRRSTVAFGGTARASGGSETREKREVALATFALAIATPQASSSPPLEEMTGGVQGIVVLSATFDMPVPAFNPLEPSIWTYHSALIVGLLIYWAAQNIVASRTGRALMAIRDNPIAARAMGINSRTQRPPSASPRRSAP